MPEKDEYYIEQEHVDEIARLVVQHHTPSRANSIPKMSSEWDLPYFKVVWGEIGFTDKQDQIKKQLVKGCLLYFEPFIKDYIVPAKGKPDTTSRLGPHPKVLLLRAHLKVMVKLPDTVLECYDQLNAKTTKWESSNPALKLPQEIVKLWDSDALEEEVHEIVAKALDQVAGNKAATQALTRARTTSRNGGGSVVASPEVLRLVSTRKTRRELPGMDLLPGRDKTSKTRRELPGMDLLSGRDKTSKTRRELPGMDLLSGRDKTSADGANGMAGNGRSNRLAAGAPRLKDPPGRNGRAKEDGDYLTKDDDDDSLGLGGPFAISSLRIRTSSAGLGGSSNGTGGDKTLQVFHKENVDGDINSPKAASSGGDPDNSVVADDPNDSVVAGIGDFHAYFVQYLQDIDLLISTADHWLNGSFSKEEIVELIDLINIFFFECQDDVEESEEVLTTINETIYPLPLWALQEKLLRAYRHSDDSDQLLSAALDLGFGQKIMLDAWRKLEGEKMKLESNNSEE